MKKVKQYSSPYLFPINPAVSREIADAIVRSVLGSLDHLIIKKNITYAKLINLNHFLVRMKQSKIWLNFNKNL